MRAKPAQGSSQQQQRSSRRSSRQVRFRVVNNCTGNNTGSRIDSINLNFNNAAANSITLSNRFSLLVDLAGSNEEAAGASESQAPGNNLNLAQAFSSSEFKPGQSFSGLRLNSDLAHYHSNKRDMAQQLLHNLSSSLNASLERGDMAAASEVVDELLALRQFINQFCIASGKPTLHASVNRIDISNVAQNCELNVTPQGNNSMNALIDTGASLSCVSFDIAEKAGLLYLLEPLEGTMSGADGSRFKVFGSTLMRFWTHGKWLEFEFVVIGGTSNNMILGLDWLHSINAVISLPQAMITSSYGNLAITITRTADKQRLASAKAHQAKGKQLQSSKSVHWAEELVVIRSFSDDADEQADFEPLAASSPKKTQQQALSSQEIGNSASALAQAPPPSSTVEQTDNVRAKSRRSRRKRAPQRTVTVAAMKVATFDRDIRDLESNVLDFHERNQINQAALQYRSVVLNKALEQYSTDVASGLPDSESNDLQWHDDNAEVIASPQMLAWRIELMQKQLAITSTALDLGVQHFIGKGAKTRMSLPVRDDFEAVCDEQINDILEQDAKFLTVSVAGILAEPAPAKPKAKKDKSYYKALERVHEAQDELEADEALASSAYPGKEVLGEASDKATMAPASGKDLLTCPIADSGLFQNPELSDDEALSDEDLAATKVIRDKFKALFAYDGKPGIAPEKFAHAIRIKAGTRPVYEAMRTYTAEKLACISDQIKLWLANDIVEKIGYSQWNIPLWVVPKADKTHRVVLDARRLNESIERERYPLPRPKELFNQMRGARYFTKLDLKEAFLQLPLTAESKACTAFACSEGVFQFRRMPYGLINSAEAFQSFIHREDVLPIELRMRCVANYIDDLIIYSKSKKQHLADVNEVLSRLEACGLRVKPSKCNFMRETVSFLGFIITAAGVHMDPARTATINNFERPRDCKGIQRFIGMVQFVHRFIPGLAEIAAPLTALMATGTKFTWNCNTEFAFSYLKHLLTVAPVLALPMYDLPFVVMADASGEACGAVLVQDQGKGEQPIAYCSHKFSAAESKWTTTEREAFALYYAVRHFEDYLRAAKVVLRTDHKPITWLVTCKNPVPKVYRWLLWISEFDVAIEYLPGKQQFVADALSRDAMIPRHHQACPSLGRVAAIHLDEAYLAELAATKQAQADCPELGMILQAKVKGEAPPAARLKHSRRFNKLLKHWEDISVSPNGICYIKMEHLRVPVLIVPHTRRQDVFHLFHSIPTAGHLGREKTLYAVMQQFYWPGMTSDIARWIQLCLDCCRSKTSNVSKVLPLHDSEAPSVPFQRVHIDVNSMPIYTQAGNHKVLVITDALTKWVEAYAMPNERAVTVAECVVDFVARHGCPLEIHTDQGTNFESKLFQRLCDEFGINRTHTTSHHPQGNSPAENFNRTLNAMLRPFITQYNNNWDRLLPQVVMAYRCAKHDSIGMSPFEALYNRKPILPGSLVLGPEHLPGTSTGFCQPEVVELWRQLRSRILTAKAKQNYQHNKHATAKDFVVGDLVLVRNFAAHKLAPRYQGVYTVINSEGKGVYRLQDDLGTERVLNAEHLKLFRSRASILAEGDGLVLQQYDFSFDSGMHDEDDLTLATGTASATVVGETAQAQTPVVGVEHATPVLTTASGSRAVRARKPVVTKVPKPAAPKAKTSGKAKTTRSRSLTRPAKAAVKATAAPPRPYREIIIPVEDSSNLVRLAQSGEITATQAANRPLRRELCVPVENCRVPSSVRVASAHAKSKDDSVASSQSTHSSTSQVPRHRALAKPRWSY